MVTHISILSSNFGVAYNFFLFFCLFGQDVAFFFFFTHHLVGILCLLEGWRGLLCLGKGDCRLSSPATPAQQQ